jgi:hypothetical protein
MIYNLKWREYVSISTQIQQRTNKITSYSACEVSSSGACQKLKAPNAIVSGTSFPGDLI